MKRADGSRRVVVTGYGMVTPIGLDSKETWASMKQGKCGVSRIENFELDDLYIHIAGEIKGFDPATHVKSKKIQYGERYSWFAGRAADEAWEMSGLPTPYNNPYRSCCIIGSGAGGYSTVEQAYRDLFIKNKRATHPLTLLRIIGSSAAAHVGIEFGIKGPTFATCSACSTATHAIGIAYDYIRNGLVDVGVAGASEAVLTYGSMRTWQAMRVLSPDGCFPFSKRRNGTVLAEGSGILVLEDYEHAKRRGANILAELMGYGMSSDSKDMVNPDIDGPRTAMQFALDDAGIDASEIDYLNAHGTATTLNDVNETNAIKDVFGDYAQKLAISSTKSMHGHLLGAGGGVEAGVCIKAIQEGWVPPTIGYGEPDPKCDLDYVPNEGRDMKVRYAMSNSFAFGGLNAVLVFGPAPT
ncbi:MAG: beta-ketoacyl-[acyl-carrier-protein] synthase family protein [Hyphomicrobiaceae bacterium]|nr:beta-ketoacyl-[acyl-carrier-protein] synthase family protein [Hyphomicrobiaceae bacterium]MCC0010137.1 beta-ketoacyl-[acyl-carrier-protein] synthase family protein [Hyphomicrobiaceae bacterium]